MGGSITIGIIEGNPKDWTNGTRNRDSAIVSRSSDSFAYALAVNTYTLLYG